MQATIPTLLAAAALTLPSCTTPPSFTAGTFVDLTHPFSAETIYWPTAKSFSLEKDFDGVTDQGYYYAANTFTAAEHGGTHIDAPVHFAKEKQSVDDIPLARLIAPAVVVDVSERSLRDSDYQVSLDDLQDFEAEHGRIPDAAIVLLHTGFGRYWPDRERYMGTAELGQKATLELHFPGLHPAAATWLVRQRNVSAVGIDTPSIDYGKSRLFHSHRVLFKKSIPAFENVANLHRLPPTGALVIALPMKIEGGSGGPLRIVARLPDQTGR